MLVSCHHGYEHRLSPSYHHAVVVALLAIFLTVLAGAVAAQVTPTVLSSPAVAPVSTPPEVTPPTPTRYFSDSALLTTAKFADALNLRLEAFEHATTDQFLVVIFPKMQSEAEKAGHEGQHLRRADPLRHSRCADPPAVPGQLSSPLTAQRLVDRQDERMVPAGIRRDRSSERPSRVRPRLLVYHRSASDGWKVRGQGTAPRR